MDPPGKLFSTADKFSLASSKERSSSFPSSYIYLLLLFVPLSRDGKHTPSPGHSRPTSGPSDLLLRRSRHTRTTIQCLRLHRRPSRRRTSATRLQRQSYPKRFSLDQGSWNRQCLQTRNHSTRRQTSGNFRYPQAQSEI